MLAVRVVAVAFLLSFVGLAAAEDLTPTKRADIDHLLQMTGALDMGRQMSAAVVTQMTQTLRKARPDIPERVMELIPIEVNSAIAENLDELKDLVIPIYHQHFSAEEIKAMIGFYSTDVGVKIIRVMPVLLQESMQAGQQCGASLGPTINQRIRSRLELDGVKP